MLDYNNITTEGSKQSEYQYIRRSSKELHVQIFHKVNKIPSITTLTPSQQMYLRFEFSMRRSKTK